MGPGGSVREEPEAVGPEGRVYAVEVEEKKTRSLAASAKARGLSNVSAVLAPYDDPGLEPRSVDMIFVCNTYHHIENRTAYFARAAKTLRPKARVVVIDMLPKAWLQYITGHTIRPEVIRTEMQEAGYVEVREYDFLRQQSFIVFEVPQ